MLSFHELNLLYFCFKACFFEKVCLCMWRFLQTHNLFCFSVPLAYFVHLSSCCRCHHHCCHHHHHHCAKKKAVTCGRYMSNMPPLFPHSPYPPPPEHNCRSKHGFIRPASLGTMMCLVVESTFGLTILELVLKKAQMKLKKAFGLIFAGEHKH